MQDIWHANPQGVGTHRLRSTALICFLSHGLRVRNPHTLLCALVNPQTQVAKAMLHFLPANSRGKNSVPAFWPPFLLSRSGNIGGANTALYPVKTPDTEKHPTASKSSKRLACPRWQELRRGTITRETQQQHSSYIGLSERQEDGFQRQTSCATQLHTLLGPRMGGILVSTVYFSALHSILNKQTYWEEFFFFCS